MNDENEKTEMRYGPSPPQAELEPEALSSERPSLSRTLSPEQRQQILDAYNRCRAIRRTARAVGHDRKTVRRVLEEAGVRIAPAGGASTDRASKLDPFRETVREKVAHRLTLTRILREIREQGYTGSRTILADYVRSLPGHAAPTAAKRRFETPPGEELQVDWSVFTVMIAGVLRCVHALGCVLAYSRYLYLRLSFSYTTVKNILASAQDRIPVDKDAPAREATHTHHNIRGGSYYAAGKEDEC